MVKLITGRAGAGKTTLARKLHVGYVKAGLQVLVLDGDVVRKHFAGGFGPTARCIHLRRLAKIAALAEGEGNMVIVACIAPLRAERAMMRGYWRESETIYLPGGTMWPGTYYEEGEYD